MGEARPGLRDQMAVAPLGPSILLTLLPTQAGTLCSSLWEVRGLCPARAFIPQITMYIGYSIFKLAVPRASPWPHRQEGSPYLQVQDHLSRVVLIGVCLDTVDPRALEEIPEG